MKDAGFSGSQLREVGFNASILKDAGGFKKLIKLKKLFLDDLRTVDMVYDKSMETEFDIVRTYDEFISYIQSKGLPELIALITT